MPIFLSLFPTVSSTEDNWQKQHHNFEMMQKYSKTCSRTEFSEANRPVKGFMNSGGLKAGVSLKFSKKDP